jgi:hypothetical protein
MKRFCRVIAMVLVFVMLACSFTSCLSYVYRSSSTPKRVAFAVVDIVTLPVSLIALLIYVLISEAPSETEFQTYLASLENNTSSEYLALMNKIYSLPEADFASLKQILDSLPETEHNALKARIYSLSEAERVSLVNAYIALPETEIISSIERINSLSETDRVSLLQDFESLSEVEIATLIEELESLHEETDSIVAVDYSPEKAYVALALSELNVLDKRGAEFVTQ